MSYRSIFLLLVRLLAHSTPSLASLLTMFTECPPDTVWYAFVGPGFPGTPSYTKLTYPATMSYSSLTPNAGISLKVARVYNPGPENITQIEFGTDTAADKIWYDVSLVDGSVFGREGVSFYADRCPSKSFPQCKAVVCAPNEVCEDAYKYPTEDENTKSCSLEASLTVGFCTGEKVHGPDC